MASLTPGLSVTPAIRLARRLGVGGMGSVWLADHLTLHTKVVVKFMSDELVGSAEARERFSREAAAASQVKSPHVVQVFDHGITTDSVPFIVMELLEGETLGERLEARGALAPSEVAAIVEQVCRALARAHAREIIHRDIKPDNIFLCPSPDDEAGVFVKVLDFGIARGAQLEGVSATMTGATLGTPQYMSPEQAVGAKTIDHRTDLWSVGMVAFTALTGRAAFEGDNFGALAVAISTGPMPVPSELRPGLSSEVDAWFAKACARQVDVRFSSARELASALRIAVASCAAAPRVQARAPGGSTATLALRTQFGMGSRPTPPPPRTTGAIGAAPRRWRVPVAAAAVVATALSALATSLAVAPLRRSPAAPSADVADAVARASASGDLPSPSRDRPASDGSGGPPLALSPFPPPEMGGQGSAAAAGPRPDPSVGRSRRESGEEPGRPLRGSTDAAARPHAPPLRHHDPIE